MHRMRAVLRAVRPAHRLLRGPGAACGPAAGVMHTPHTLHVIPARPLQPSQGRLRRCHHDRHPRVAHPAATAAARPGLQQPRASLHSPAAGWRGVFSALWGASALAVAFVEVWCLSLRTDSNCPAERAASAGSRQRLGWTHAKRMVGKLHALHSLRPVCSACRLRRGSDGAGLGTSGLHKMRRRARLLGACLRVRASLQAGADDVQAKRSTQPSAQQSGPNQRRRMTAQATGPCSSEQPGWQLPSVGPAAPGRLLQAGDDDGLPAERSSAIGGTQARAFVGAGGLHVAGRG
jgi:hypothetical protein